MAEPTDATSFWKYLEVPSKVALKKIKDPKEEKSE